MPGLIVGLLIVLLPWIAGDLAPAAAFPPLLAYLLFPGRGLVVAFGLFIVIWGVTGRRLAWDAAGHVLEAVSGTRTFAIAGLLVIAWVAWARVPQAEKMADAFGGDEPKYLRIAYSLLRDTDTDIGSGRTATPDAATRWQQVRSLVLTTRDAAAGLFSPPPVPADHPWNAGNWTVRGLDGGLYHLQPPGLPAIVAVALGIGEALLPERDPGLYVFGLLVIVWTLAARELWLLAVETSRDETVAALVVTIVFASAPVFVGGYQLFPESLSLLLFPWLLRRVGASERALGAGSAIATGFAAGYLLWIHPKLTVVALFFAFLALVRPNTPGRSRALFFVAFSVTVFLALLYCYRISGLFRPEGLYIRQAEEYVGSPNPLSLRYAAGLIKGLVGGRDGLFLFAPVLALGFLAPPRLALWSRPLVEFSALFVVVWLTSAVHDGASLGSPARLMEPVVFAPALVLARALRDDEGCTSKLRAAALMLFAFGCLVTNTMNSDWRRNVNPYKGMFAMPELNFEPDLPGNSFAEAAWAEDLEKALAIFVFALVAGAALRRRESLEGDPWTPAWFGVSTCAWIAGLAWCLHALSPPV